MSFDHPLALGIILAGGGLLLWVTAAVIFAFNHKRRPVLSGIHPQPAASFNGHKDGVLIVQTGGKLVWVNPVARQAFNLQVDETPNLESLGRKFRPSEALFDLCAADSQARLVLGGRPIEASSYSLPLQPEGYRVIVLRFMGLASRLASDSNAIPAEKLQVFIELSQTFATSLDFGRTLRTILDSLERLFPSDLCEISLLDDENDTLVPYRLVASPGGERLVEKGREGYGLGFGFSGRLARERRFLFFQDVEVEPSIGPAPYQHTHPLRSYLGVPMLIGQKCIGTIELASYTPACFQFSDCDLLVLISGQAAVAIHNTLRYEQEQRRSAELNGLAILALAFGSNRDLKNVFERLVHVIHPLIRTHILGFLLYNEINCTLEGQAPFAGIPPQFMDMYRVRINANSPLEKVFLDQDVILTENANEDSRWSELGLEPIAVAAGLLDTVLMPLTTGGRMLGYLQASNHRDGSRSFTKAELHLLMIVANQAALIIDNSTLVQQSRQQALPAEGTHRMASLSGSAVTGSEMSATQPNLLNENHNSSTDLTNRLQKSEPDP